jgi:hypothetical protein
MMTGELNEQQLYETAKSLTGLDDWGTDESFRAGLRKLIEAVEAMRVADVLRKPVADQAVGLLATRLHLQDDARRQPEILDGKIERPLIVTGAPRSGTTWLYELLSLDAAARAPLDWEVISPWPAPDIRTFDTDPRIADLQASYDHLLSQVPGLATMHHWDARAPQECNCFTTLHFVSSNFWSSFGIPDYLDWLVHERHSGVFNTHRRVLQQLQWKGPRGRWLLKSPPHLLMLDDLLAAYPDAMIIQTHREPQSIVASLASLVRALRQASFPDVPELTDPKVIGGEVMMQYGEALERAALSRDIPDIDRRIFDVPYRDTLSDPIGTVKRIYEHFGMDFTPAYEQRLAELVNTDRPSAGGRHRYDPEEFGIPAMDIPNRLPAYRARFGDLL